MRGLEVLHCDNHVLVVSKPACLPVVPDSSGDESLLDQAKAWVKREFHKPGAVFLGVVHRLDRPVSGVVVFARTSKAADRLSAQFRERGVTKDYLGVVLGLPRREAGELEQYLMKDSASNVVRVVSESMRGAKRALTSFELLRSSGEEHLLALHPHTGRSHQLRVACALGLGAPLAGDLKYGAERPLSDKSIALHAHRLGFDHPTRDERLEFELEPPSHPIWAIARRG